MKKSKLTEAQIVFAIKQSETGVAVPEVCERWELARPPFTTSRKSMAV